MEMIRLCLDNILDEQVFAESGNVKSSVGSDRDRLVHWCHGAPGAVHLYVLASKVSSSVLCFHRYRCWCRHNRIYHIIFSLTVLTNLPPLPNENRPQNLKKLIKHPINGR